MNLYEHTIIARQDTSPSQLKQLQEKYANLVEGLIEQSIELYADNVEKANQEAATDKFGNFQEKFMGYVIRIQEEKPLEDTAKGESNLIRRRGVAFDNDGKLFAASDLTYTPTVADKVVISSVGHQIIRVETTEQANTAISYELILRS